MSFSQPRREQERQKERERENTSSALLDSLYSLTPRRSVSKWLFYRSGCKRVFMCVRLHQHLWVSPCECLCSSNTTCVFSRLCVSFVSVSCINVCVCVCVYLHRRILVGGVRPSGRCSVCTEWGWRRSWCSAGELWAVNTNVRSYRRNHHSPSGSR